jgi:hypothetical protein
VTSHLAGLIDHRDHLDISVAAASYSRVRQCLSGELPTPDEDVHLARSAIGTADSAHPVDVDPRIAQYLAELRHGAGLVLQMDHQIVHWNLL